jgi:hypothetical protein
MVQATRFHRRKRHCAAHNDGACEACDVQFVHRMFLGRFGDAALHVARLLPARTS